MTSLIVTFVGPDRPGLVSALSDRVAEHGANWTDSIMANFAGQFAGIVQLQASVERCDSLITALQAMELGDARIQIIKTDAVQKPATVRRLQLDLVGQDRPGIIHGISSELARYSVSIAKLQTFVASGAMSGEQMFHLSAQLIIPTALNTESLLAGLEGLANELMVDITFDSGQGDD